MSLQSYISHLDLSPHPEGGYYKETGRCTQAITSATGLKVPLFTNILFVLTHENPSRFHQIQSDEVWYYHDGKPLTVHCIYPDGTYKAVKLGRDVENGEVLQFEVAKGVIFGSSVDQDWALVSCMVSPGFDFREFKLFTRKELMSMYPEHENIITKLTHDD